MLRFGRLCKAPLSRLVLHRLDTIESTAHAVIEAARVARNNEHDRVVDPAPYTAIHRELAVIAHATHEAAGAVVRRTAWDRRSRGAPATPGPGRPPAGTE